MIFTYSFTFYFSLPHFFNPNNIHNLTVFLSLNNFHILRVVYLLDRKFYVVLIYHLSTFFMISYLVKDSNIYLNIEQNFNIEGKFENHSSTFGQTQQNDMLANDAFMADGLKNLQRSSKVQSGKKD